MGKKKPSEEPKLIEPTITQINSQKVHQYGLFNIVDHDGEFLVAVGNQIVSRVKCNSLMQAQSYIDSKPWEVIFNISAMFAKLNNEQSK